MRRSLRLALAPFVIAIGCGPSGSGSGTTQGTGGSGGAGGSGGTAGSGAGTTTSTTTTTTTTTTTSTNTGFIPSCGADPVAPTMVLPDAADPEQGLYTLDEALEELPDGPGPLRAILDTDLGEITCTLHAAEAPVGVASFIGLARGRRPWRDSTINKWVQRRFYDGLLFHRVIPDFVAQGGDPKGNGTGGPGYKFADELVGLTHLDGTLAYANSGPNTNGSQFYICDGPQSFLDPSYTIFGQCEPTSVVSDITHVETNSSDKPLTPVHIKTVTITRCAP